MSDERELTVPEKLRLYADYYEAHPDIPAPYLGDFNSFVYTKEAFAQAARSMGGADKRAASGYIELRHEIAPGVVVCVNILQEQVCKRKAVRYEEVPARAAFTREIVEWECKPILKGGDE